MVDLYNVPGLPHVAAGYGLSTPWGVLLPPGGKVAAYVRSAGAAGISGDDESIVGNLVPSLGDACRRVRAGRGDTIVLLPGHSEEISDASPLEDLVAGTRIVGVGRGGLTPTLRWVAAGAQLTLDQADVTLQGLRLRMEGANGVTKAVAVTAADCGIYGCDIEVASGASNKAAIACEVGAGGARFSFVGNRVRGTAGHNVTDGLLVAAAVDGVYAGYNRMIASATSANGLIRLSAAATSVHIEHSVIFNTMTTAAAVGIALGSAAATGVVNDCHIGTLSGDGMASGTDGISFSGSVDFRFFNVLVSDSANAAGIAVIAAADAE